MATIYDRICQIITDQLGVPAGEITPESRIVDDLSADSLDIVDIQTNYIGGVAPVTALPEPATSALSKLYHQPLKDWLAGLGLSAGNSNTGSVPSNCFCQNSIWLV